jgi:septal ring-binding cell division protein DamX
MSLDERLTMTFSYSRIPSEVIILVAQYLATLTTFKVGKGLSVIIRDTAAVGFTVNGTKVAGLKGNKRYNRPNKPERDVFYAAYNTAKGITPDATVTTKKTGKRAKETQAQINARMAKVRAARKCNTGKAAPAATPAATLASGKLTADDKLKLVSDVLATLAAALAS